MPMDSEVYADYLSMGGNEIVNAARVAAILRADGCYTGWLSAEPCDTLQLALGEAGANWGDVEAAPWFDRDVEASARFYGVMPVSLVDGLNSMRSAEATDRIADGQILSRIRKRGKTMRLKGVLLGADRAAIEYGQAWLSAAVDPDACGQHGDRCGLTDLTWYAACPPEPGAGEEPEDYARRVRTFERYLHDVAAVSGPTLIGDTYKSREFYAQDVEITFASEQAYVFGAAREIPLPPTVPDVVEDEVRNRVRQPSAELLVTPAQWVSVYYNLVTNARLEVDATGWSAESTGLPGGSVAGERVTGELAAVGTASYRATFTAPGIGAGGALRIEFERLPLGVAGRRLAGTAWAAAVATSGAPVLGELRGFLRWENADGSTVYRTDDLGPIPESGAWATGDYVARPSGATRGVVGVQLDIDSWTSGDVVRLYGDAFGLMAPRVVT